MIQKSFLLTTFTILFFVTGYTQVKDFKTDVDTNKKPWTNLDFYNDPANFQFAIVADRNGGNRRGVFQQGVEKLNLVMPEFVMCVGDLIAGYTTDTALIARQWNEVNQEISNLKMPFFYLPGNHDITNKVMEKEWEKRYGKRYYSFNYKNVLFIILDSNDDDDYNLTRQQTDFVLKTLKENQGVRWTYLFMHHPIWTYDTGSRFPEIQEALKSRKHTVIAGHEHRYHHEEINNANYYILATTGAGSELLGEPFGEFDHISWITMTDNGPVMANLKLDGILPHDVANERTRAMAEPLIANSKMQHLLLCNPGNKFTNGTLYLSFKNPSETDMTLTLNIFHHHQLAVELPQSEITIPAGSEKQVEILLSSSKPLDYANIDLLCTEWEIRYDGAENKKFALQGKSQFAVQPTKTEFITKNINTFLDKAEIAFNNPFTSLTTVYSANKAAGKTYSQPVQIDKNTSFSFQIKNSKNEMSGDEIREFRKIGFQESVKVSNPQACLKYASFEGDWETIPDFKSLTPKKEGTAADFAVADIAPREDHWALVYNGFIKIEEDNLYIFRVNADDAARLYIGGELVADEKTKIKGENVGAVALKKGFHPVRIEYLEKEGNQRLRFYVKNNEQDDWKLMENEWFWFEK
jgi:hypothetical protein